MNLHSTDLNKSNKDRVYKRLLERKYPLCTFTILVLEEEAEIYHEVDLHDQIYCTAEDVDLRPGGRRESVHNHPPSPEGRKGSVHNLSPSPEGRKGSVHNLPPSPEGRKGSVHNLSPSPEGRKGSVHNLPPSPEGRKGNVHNLSPSPEGRKGSVHNLPPSPEGRKGSVHNLSPSPEGGKGSVHNLPPSPGGKRESVQNLPSTPGGRKGSVHNLPPSPGGRRETVHNLPPSPGAPPPLPERLVPRTKSLIRPKPPNTNRSSTKANRSYNNRSATTKPSTSSPPTIPPRAPRKSVSFTENTSQSRRQIMVCDNIRQSSDVRPSPAPGYSKRQGSGVHSGGGLAEKDADSDNKEIVEKKETMKEEEKEKGVKVRTLVLCWWSEKLNNLTDSPNNKYVNLLIFLTDSPNSMYVNLLILLITRFVYWIF